MTKTRIAGASLGGGSSVCLPISVIIPALNEEGSIGAVVRCASAAAEVRVVDGGSEDRTCLRAERAAALAKRGIRFLAVGSDMGFLRVGAASLLKMVSG